MKNIKTLNFLPYEKSIFMLNHNKIELSVFYGTVIQNDLNPSLEQKLICAERIIKTNRKTCLISCFEELEQELEIIVRNFWNENPSAIVQIYSDEKTYICADGQYRKTQGILTKK